MFESPMREKKAAFIEPMLLGTQKLPDGPELVNELKFNDIPP
jgi:hypothetical protein